MVAHSEEITDVYCKEALLDEHDEHEVRNHLRLGIQFDAADAFVKKILACQSSKCCSKMDLSKIDVRAVREMLKNDPDYDDEDDLGSAGVGWIQKEYPNNLTGYDLLVGIRCWLRKQKRERQTDDPESNQHEQSVCEEKQGTKRFSGVGKADVFMSHAQSENPVDTLKLMAQAHKRDGNLAKIPKLHAFQWVDYFSLRQLASNDFVRKEICNLIASIGTTIVGADPVGKYWTRSFCVLESFATIQSNQTLLFPESVYVWEKQIKSENAICRNKKAQQEIKEYIEENLGFDKVDETLKVQVRNAVALRKKQGRLRCLTWIVVLLQVGAAGGAYALPQEGRLVLFALSVLLMTYPFAGLFGSLFNRCGCRPSNNKCLKSYEMVGSPKCTVVWCTFCVAVLISVLLTVLTIAIAMQGKP